MKLSQIRNRGALSESLSPFMDDEQTCKLFNSLLEYQLHSILLLSTVVASAIQPYSQPGQESNGRISIAATMHIVENRTVNCCKAKAQFTQQRWRPKQKTSCAIAFH